MYKMSAGQYIYSPSDLILYMRSHFASWMSRLEVDHPEQLTGIEKDQDQMLGLLAQQGNEHEANYLSFIKQKFGNENVIEIERGEQAATATLQAMQKGYQVIFQAYLERDEFKGYADFLVRQEGKSVFGDYYYEAWDTKLSKSTKPYFIVQLCCYSWMLELIQGAVPDHAVVVLGNKKEERYRLPAYYSYFLNLKKQFLQDQADFKSDWQFMPDIALCNDYGAWGTFAKQLLADSDSLALVANIRKSHIKKLLVSGIHTLTELAHTEQSTIKGISPETFTKLKAQANIQLDSRGLEKPLFAIQKTDAGKGLSSLPPKSNFDVYFDIEGHPLEEGGLEYLWGVSFDDPQVAQGKQYAFKDWWAHNQEQEKKAFEGFIDWIYDRWQQDPAMHVHHYATYEITAINKLANRYQTRKDVVAELLKNRVFIDLYKIVKSGLLVGEPKYSIKNIEHLYRGKRTTEVANGGDSVVFYEHWREKGGAENWDQSPYGYQAWQADPDHFDWTLWKELKEIRDYNIDDCESTLELGRWLREQQIINTISYLPPKDESADEIVKTDRQIQNEEKRQALMQRQQRLIDQFESDPSLKVDPQAKLLVSLIHFYDRERKPKIFSYYQRLEKTDEELFEDDTVIYDLSLSTKQEDNGKLNCVAHYSSDQSIRKDKFDTAIIQGTNTRVSKIEFTQHDDNDVTVVQFVINEDQIDSLEQIPLTLFGDEAKINTENLENRLCQIVETYFETRQLPRLLETIVNQANPRFRDNTELLPVTRHQFPDNASYLNAIIKTVEGLDQSCLCIQGPPGAGKTYTAHNIIKALVKEGKRIGIMSNSHAAIMNLMEDLIVQLPDTHISKVGGYGSQTEFKEKVKQIFSSDFDLENYPNFEYRSGMQFTTKKPYDQFQIIGATVYAFASELSYDFPVDYLFVDEASQVALANLMAVSGATSNVVLMGDQMQLEQPIQGSHPDDSGKSALEFMLKDHAVIPDEKGIFLERTFRMHPDVCHPLSEIVYEGKLQADDDNVHQAINIPNPKIVTKQNGILSIPVEHEGNTQSSEEEVLVVQQIIDELKTGTFIDKKRLERPITDADILVISPYNMQVNLLKEKLKGEIKIGTIDKFQGQEAPVVIISMAVSDVEDSPRGLDFVFDINRLNVAVSRAKALAVIVRNTDLEHCTAMNLANMRRIGMFGEVCNAVK